MGSKRDLHTTLLGGPKSNPKMKICASPVDALTRLAVPSSLGGLENGLSFCSLTADKGKRTTAANRMEKGERKAGNCTNARDEH